MGIFRGRVFRRSANGHLVLWNSRYLRSRVIARRDWIRCGFTLVYGRGALNGRNWHNSPLVPYIGSSENNLSRKMQGRLFECTHVPHLCI